MIEPICSVVIAAADRRSRQGSPLKDEVNRPLSPVVVQVADELMQVSSVVELGPRLQVVVEHSAVATENRYGSTSVVPEVGNVHLDVAGVWPPPKDALSGDLHRQQLYARPGGRHGCHFGVQLGTQSQIGSGRSSNIR